MKKAPDYSESLLVHFRRVESLKEAALDYPSISLNKRQLCDLELLLNRAFYPLRGYLNQADYHSVLKEMRLADGTLWPIPVCLDVERTRAGVPHPRPSSPSKRYGNRIKNRRPRPSTARMTPHSTPASQLPANPELSLSLPVDCMGNVKYP